MRIISSTTVRTFATPVISPKAHGSTSRLSLITPGELHAWMGADGDSCAVSATSRPLLLEAWNGLSRPPAHIPGAVLVCMEEIDVYDEVSPGQPARVSGNYSLKPPAALRAALEAAGVTAARPAVVYTQSFKAGAAEPIVAARLAWALAYAGVEHVALLGGGMHAWREAGLATAAVLAVRPQPPPDFFHGYSAVDPQCELPFPRNPHFLALTPDVHTAIRAQSSDAGGHGAAAAGGAAVLADVRSWREYVGEGHDYPFALPHGRIPTARWAQWGPSTYVGGDFFSPHT